MRWSAADLDAAPDFWVPLIADMMKESAYGDAE